MQQFDYHPHQMMVMIGGSVRKTSLMRAIERAHAGEEISAIICRAYAEYGSYEKAAAFLGVSRATLEMWVEQLGGQRKAELVFISASERLPEAAA